MAYNLGDIVVKLKADTADLEKGLDKASKQGSTFGQKFQKGAKVAAVALATVGTALTVVAKKSTDFTVEYVKSSKKLARELGVTTEESSRLVAATRRMGITAEDASKNFGIFAKQIVASTKDAKANAIAHDELKNKIQKTKLEIKATTEEIKTNGDKSGELKNHLEGLNITVRDLEESLKATNTPFQRLNINTVDAKGNQKDFNTLLFEVADKFKEMPDGIDKTAASMELFGRSGKDMIKFLNLGSEGIKKLEEEADKLGITLTPKTIVRVEEYIESQKKLKENTDALKIAVGTATAPILTKFNEILTSIVDKFIESDGPMKNFIANVIAFGGPIAMVAAAIVTFAANMVTAWPVIAAILKFIGGLFSVTAGLVIAAIGIWVSNIIYFIKNFKDVKATFMMLVQGFIAGLRQVSSNFVQWKNNIGNILSTVNGWIAAIPRNVANAFNSVVSWFRGLGGRIKSAIGNLSRVLFDAGVSILNGFWDGLKSKWESVKSWVGGLGSKIKDLKGPLDKDKVLLINEGRAIMEGLNRGLVDGFRPVSATLGSMGGAIQGGMAASTVNNTRNTSITGPINIGSQQDADYFFKRIDRNSELESMGLSPA